ncbi:MAG: LPS assembly lipoprotein LptE [Tateyamaria sp.]|uniref:LPS assembly lipoprotein LptE n=1 Tax=Tateyamaria sp. TaxID=1929288 RepID=UPI0032A0310E
MARIGALLLTLLLASCGFQPVHGPNGAGSTLQNRVLVDEPDDRLGFQLVQRLEERLGRGNDPAFRLAVDLNVAEEARAIDPEGDIRRFHLIGTAAFTLSETGSGTVIRADNIENFVGYSATGTTVATLAARRDAQERLMTILADQIVLRLQASAL